MDRRAILVCLVAGAFLSSIPAHAEHTRYWRQSDFPEFEKGTAKGVAIRSDGTLTSAPRFESFSDPDLAYLWTMRLDSHGHLFAAGGSNAKVLRFDDTGKPTTVFESAELAAQAIAFDDKDNLYVATSPDGKVYKVTTDGQKSVFFEPKTKYIWALAFDSKDTLFVATGDTGQVFAVTPDGKGALFYQTNERHARSLAFDSKGNLLVGTAPNGLILRLEIARKGPHAIPEAGAPFVVYETSKSEVTSLVLDSAGNLYAAAIGEKTRVEGAPFAIQNAASALQPSSPAAVQGLTAPQTQGLTAQAAPMYPFLSPSAMGTEVVKIAPDGSPQTLWTSRETLVFAIGLSSEKPLLGTGNAGEIIKLEGNEVYSSIAKTASAQVTGLLAASDGRIFVATANPGKIFILGPGYDLNGTFESSAFDAKIYSRWGRLAWWGENTDTRGKVEFYVRSGNTSDPNANWSSWAGPYSSQSAGESVGCPPARFTQWKAVFTAAEGGAAPSVSWVSLAYLPKNVAPVIDDIALQDPGIRVAGFAPPLAGPGAPVPAQLRNPRSQGGSPSTASSSAEALPKSSKVEVPPQGFEEKGYQAVLWSAHDDNDDDLVFTVYYRGEGEHNWRLLKENVKQRYYSWDTTSMPDGAYYLKIVASDSPSNPPDQALTTERESERFEVANTPPRIEGLRAKPDGSNASVSFKAISDSVPIAQAHYSLDAGDWKSIFPESQLSDAPRESYEIPLSGLSAGEHTIAVQVGDRFDNTAAAKVTFTIAGGGTQ